MRGQQFKPIRHFPLTLTLSFRPLGPQGEGIFCCSGGELFYTVTEIIQ